MRTQIKKHFLILFTLCFVLGIFTGCKNESNNKDGYVEPVNTEKIVSTDGFEAKLYYDGDHYVLSVFTNIIENDFSFTYDKSKFLLDDIGIMFENASFSENEDEKTRTCTMKMDNNSLYVFNFIKLGKEEMKIGKNIKIN